MDWITVIVNWFGENESVLSGIAAFVAIFALLLSPLGGNFKAFFKSRKEPGQTPYQDIRTANGKSRQAGKPAIYIEAFTGNSDEARNFAIELNEEVRRAVTNFTGSILVTDKALADYIANVSVLLTGSHCRVTLRLQDHHNNEDFWSGRFEADTDNRLTAIDLLSAKLSSSIRYEVSIRFTDRQDDSFEVDLGRIGFAMTSPDSDAWKDALIRAKKWLEVHSDNSMLQAIYGGLSMHELAHGYRPISDEDRDQAEAALRKSVLLNPRSDFAHCMLGRFLLYIKLDHAGARSSYLRSLEINPLYNVGLRGLAILDVFSGEVERALELCKESTTNAGSFQADEQIMRTIATGELMRGNFDDALDWAQQAIRHAGSSTTPSLLMLAAAAGLAGNDKVASEALASLKEKHPEITIDTMRRWPFKDDADWELFVSGLKKAGLE
jgi:tetratricopeptide (TPR) repeat protein